MYVCVYMCMYVTLCLPVYRFGDERCNIRSSLTTFETQIDFNIYILYVCVCIYVYVYLTLCVCARVLFVCSPIISVG